MELRKPDPAHSSHEAESDRHKHSLEIRRGSNIFRNTNGVIRVQGKEQLVLELAPDQERILLTIDLYDGSGNHVAHLRRNRWAFNDGNRFSLNTSESPPTLFPNLPWLKVTDQETGETVLEAAVAPGEKIHVATGKFYSHRGQLIEITSHFCRIGSTHTLFGDVFEARGGTAVLG